MLVENHLPLFWTSYGQTQSRAYTFGELAEELNRTEVTLDDLDLALRVLESNGVIDSGILLNKIYISRPSKLMR